MDVFDRITARGTAAAEPEGDIFDRIAGGGAPAPSGDIFDRIAPDPAPQVPSVTPVTQVTPLAARRPNPWERIMPSAPRPAPPGAGVKPEEVTAATGRLQMDDEGLAAFLNAGNPDAVLGVKLLEQRARDQALLERWFGNQPAPVRARPTPQPPPAASEFAATPAPLDQIPPGASPPRDPVFRPPPRWEKPNTLGAALDLPSAPGDSGESVPPALLQRAKPRLRDELETGAKNLAAGAVAGLYEPDPDLMGGSDFTAFGGRLLGTVLGVGGTALATGGLGAGAFAAPAAFMTTQFLTEMHQRGVPVSRLSDPEILALATASGLVAALTPLAVGGRLSTRMATAAGMGAAQNLAEEEIIAAISKTPPQRLEAALLGGVMAGTLVLSPKIYAAIRRALGDRGAAKIAAEAVARMRPPQPEGSTPYTPGEGLAGDPIGPRALPRQTSDPDVGPASPAPETPAAPLPDGPARGPVIRDEEVQAASRQNTEALRRGAGYTDEQVETVRQVPAFRRILEGGGEGVPVDARAAEATAPAEGALLQERTPAPAPVFFSQLRRAIDEKMPNASDPETVRRLLKGAGVKDEEMLWADVEGFLAGKSRVTKAELQRHLEQNQVVLQEVEKSGAGVDPVLTQQLKDALSEVDDLGFQSVGAALSAIRTHADFAQRWDLGDRPDIVALANRYRAQAAKPKYGDYQLPGGENYRELLLTLPQKTGLPPGFEVVEKPQNQPQSRWIVTGPGPLPENRFGSGHTREEAVSRFVGHGHGAFKSRHFDEPNILAHARFNDRTLPDGRKALFLEEVQTDWHKLGQRKGYRSGSAEPTTEALEGFFRGNVAGEGNGRFLWLFDEPQVGGRTPDEVVHNALEFYRESGAFAREVNQALNLNSVGGVPDAPFKKTWHELTLRRMLRYAAENDYDALAWTTGEQQGARYDLSKQVDAIRYTEQGNGKYNVVAAKDGVPVVKKDGLTLAQVEEFVGKEIARKIESGEGKSNPNGNYGEFKGEALKVGGEGMKAFYDRILPQYAHKYGKKWGARLQNIDLPEAGTVRSLPITPEMRRSVMEQGQPLFQRQGQTGAEGGKAAPPRGAFEVRRMPDGTRRAFITLFEGRADFSTFIHEAGHYLRRVALDGADRAAVESWLEGSGVKVKDAEGRWTRDAEERFADALERYFWDGLAPTEKLGAVFRKIKTWMREVYTEITTGSRLDIGIPPHVRAAFDRMLGVAEEGAAPRAGEGVPPASAADAPPVRDFRKTKSDMEAELGRPVSDAEVYDRLGIGRPSEGAEETLGALFQGAKAEDFGPSFVEFRHRPREAVRKLLEERRGQVPEALHHPALGWIDLMWGKAGTGANDGYGLAKIEAYHPEVLDDLQGVISRMKVVDSSHPGYVQLESADHRAAVRLDWDGASKRWLLTAFRKEPGGSKTAGARPSPERPRGTTPPKAGSQRNLPSRPSESNRLFDPALAGVPESQRAKANVARAAAKAWREKGTDSPFFKRWFGESRVVDAGGKPQVVYHGTGREFDTFQVGKPDKPNWGKQMEGVYFSPRREVADSYARTAVNWDNQASDGSGRIVEAYLRVIKPAEFHDVQSFYRAKRADLMKEGFDGAIRYNDFGDPVEIVAFRPEQIKSATGNRGTFDLESPNILMQGAQEDGAPWRPPAPPEAEPPPWRTRPSTPPPPPDIRYGGGGVPWGRGAPPPVTSPGERYTPPPPRDPKVGPGAPGKEWPTRGPDDPGYTNLGDYIVHGGEGRQRGVEFLDPWEKLYFETVDEARPILKIQDLAEEALGKKLTPSQSLQFAVNRVRGASGIADLHLRKNFEPIIRGNGGTRRALTVAETHLLEDYLIARRANWLYEHKSAPDGSIKFNDPGISRERALAILGEFEKLPPAQKAELKMRAGLVWGYFKDLARMKVKAGVWDDPMMQRVTEEPYYVPLLPQQDLVASTLSGEARKRFATSVNRLVRGLRPDNEVAAPLMSPIAAAVFDTQQAVREIAKMQVWNKTIDLVENVEGLRGWIRKAPADYVPAADEGYVRVLRDGNVETYLVPDIVAEAVNELGPANFPKWLRVVSSVSSLFRRATVGWNPDFALSNAPRDVQEAAFNAGVPPWFFWKGLVHYLRKDAVWEEFMRSGGAMSGDESGVRPAYDRAQEIRYGSGPLERFGRVRDPRGFQTSRTRAFGRVWDTGKLARAAEAIKRGGSVPLDAAAWLGEVSEMATRLGLMDYGLTKKNMTPGEATHLARQSTLDFQRIGRHMKGPNQLIPFLNASIQGMDRMARTIKEDPTTAAVRFLMYGFAPMAAALAWNTQNEHYKEIPSWEKDYYWIVMAPNNSPHYIKIAKGHLFQLLVNPIQMALETSLLKTAKVSGWDIARQAMGAATPVSDATSLLPPAISEPLQQLAGRGGYDFYFNRDIVQAPGMPGSYQYDPRTSETLKAIGKALDPAPVPEWAKSPARMQHALQGILGGSATNILFALDEVLGRAGAVPKKTTLVETAPFVKRMYGQTKEWKSDLAQRDRELSRQIREKMEAGGIQRNADGSYRPNPYRSVAARTAMRARDQGDSAYAASERDAMNTAQKKLLEEIRALDAQRQLVRKGLQENQKLEKELENKAGALEAED